MTLFYFDGLNNDIGMVEYILKNAKVMQKMEIRLQDALPQKTVIQLVQKLLKFPTRSVLEFFTMKTCMQLHADVGRLNQVEFLF